MAMEENKGTSWRTWTVRKLSSSEMKSTQPYQREINMARVHKAVENFDPNKVDIVHVSFRDGKYYVIDGQHTVSILEEHNGGNPTEVICAVHMGMTYEDEAKYYAEQYTKKSVQTANDIAVAEYEAKTPEYIDIANAIATTGARMSYDRGHKTGIKIESVKAIQRLYKKDSENLLNSVKCLATAYGSYDNKLYTDAISGVMDFFRIYGDDDNFNVSRLVKVLSETDQQTLRNTVKNKKKSDASLSLENSWTETIRLMYNKKQRKSNKIECACV